MQQYDKIILNIISTKPIYNPSSNGFNDNSLYLKFTNNICTKYIPNDLSAISSKTFFSHFARFSFKISANKPTDCPITKIEEYPNKSEKFKLLK